MIIWVAIALALLVTAITALAGRGTIPANGLIGIRTPATQQTSETWAEGHKAATPTLVALSAVVLIVGTIGLFATQRSNEDATDFVGLGLLALDLVGFVVAALRANSAARRNLQ
jgi:uncharacterized membrane protein